MVKEVWIEGGDRTSAYHILNSVTSLAVKPRERIRYEGISRKKLIEGLLTKNEESAGNKTHTRKKWE